jgi:hypothetical protein
MTRRLIPLLLLAGCATPLEVYEVNTFLDAPPPAAQDQFRRALFGEYQGLARRLTAERDLWKAAAKYAAKGEAIAKGKAADPEVVVKITPAGPKRCQALCLTDNDETVEWRAPEARSGELREARERLMRGLPAARERAPTAAAKAQAAFDCWFEEVRFDLPDLGCRGAYQAAEAQLKG